MWNINVASYICSQAQRSWWFHIWSWMMCNILIKTVLMFYNENTHFYVWRFHVWIIYESTNFPPKYDKCKNRLIWKSTISVKNKWRNIFSIGFQGAHYDLAKSLVKYKYFWHNFIYKSFLGIIYIYVFYLTTLANNVTICIFN